MIDTFMALWNRGSQHKGARVFFMFTLVCTCLSLFLVTIIIPGWILFIQNNSGIMTASADEETPATPQQADEERLASARNADNGSTPVAQPSVPANIASTPSPCVATPVVPALRAHIKKPTHTRSRVPQSVPTPLALGQRPAAKLQIESHAVYSGRPSGAVSHLQSADHEEHTPTAVATRSVQPSPSTSSTSPSKKPSPQAKRHNGAQARAQALFIPVQDEHVKRRTVRHPERLIVSNCG